MRVTEDVLDADLVATIGNSFKTFGAVGDATGVTGAGTDDTAVIQAAITFCAAMGVSLRPTAGIYRVTGTLSIPSNFKCQGEPGSVLFFDVASPSGGAWLKQVNWSDAAAISNVTITGLELRGRTDWTTTGHAVLMRCDDLVIDNLKIRYFGNTGLAMWLAGNRVTLNKIVAKDCYVTASPPSASGGIRYIGGDGFLCANSYCESDDDCFQLVPSIPANINGDMSIRNAHYVNCTGKSYKGRLTAVQLFDATACAANISDFSFVAVSGYSQADATGVQAAVGLSNEKGSGSISRGSFVGCHWDSTAGITSTKGMLEISSTAASGDITDITFKDCSLVGPYSTAILIRLLSGGVAPKNITWDGGFIGAPRISAVAVNVTDGVNIQIRNARIQGCVTKDANIIRVGATSAVDGFHLHNNRIENVGDTTALRYGVQWTSCTYGSSRNNKFTKASGATTSRGHLLTSVSNVVIDGDDLSDLGGTPKIAVTSATNTYARNVTGFVTRNSGTGAIASGATITANIAHGLQVTPTVQQFTITQSAATTNDPGNVFVDTIGATNFKVNCRADPGASTLAFGWRVNAEKLG